MADFNLFEFVKEQRGRSRAQILRAVEHEVIRVSYKLRGYKRARHRAAGAEEYRRALAAVRTFLQGGGPGALSAEQWSMIAALVSG